MKTPEQMAEEYCEDHDECEFARDAFLAGYQAAKDEYKEAINIYNDVAKQMLEEAVGIMSPQDQLADANKVMNSPEKPDGWISVKDRLPEDAGEVLIVFGGGVSIACYGGDWRHPVYPMLPLLSVTHWMPLPEAPKGEG